MGIISLVVALTSYVALKGYSYGGGGYGFEFSVLRDVRLYLVSTSIFLHWFSMWMLTSWIYDYLVSNYGFNVKTAGLTVGLSLNIVGIIGGILSGILGDRLGDRLKVYSLGLVLTSITLLTITLKPMVELVI